ncbi:hypothetical protein J6590_042756 [Homalodisca vitripennis]|nr:hypothetical protein J6590_042756 [Homalodisca vitripennis]
MYSTKIDSEFSWLQTSPAPQLVRSRAPCRIRIQGWSGSLHHADSESGNRRQIPVVTLGHSCKCVRKSFPPSNFSMLCWRNFKAAKKFKYTTCLLRIAEVLR